MIGPRLSMSNIIWRPATLWTDAECRAVVAAFGLNGFLFGAWAARVPAFKERFDLEPATLGLLLLMIAGGAIVSFPIAGALSERWGAPKLTILSAWAYTPTIILLGFAPVPLVLAAALFLFGAMHGAMDVAMNGWGAQVEKRMGRSLMSVFHAMFSLGAGLGAASGYIAVRMRHEPEFHFTLAAVLCGGFALALMSYAETSYRPSLVDAAPAQFMVLPSKSLFFVGLIAFAISVGEGAMADWSAVFLTVVADATEAQAALGYVVFNASMVLTRLFGGVLVERFGPIVTVRASGSISFVGLITAIAGNDVPVILTGFALVGVGYAIVMPLVFSRAANDPDIPSGPAIASVATLAYGGMLLGPPLIGFIAQLTGMRLSFIALAGLTMLSAILASKMKVK